MARGSDPVTLRSLAMPHAGRTRYRVTSVITLMLFLAVAIFPPIAGAPDWLTFLLGLPIYVFLIAITYYRLQDAALSWAWIGFMIIPVNIGPSWDIAGPANFAISSLVCLIPMLLGWFTPKAGSANAAAPSAN